MKHSYCSGTVILALVAAAGACSSEPDGSEGNEPAVPAFPGSGATPGGATAPSAPPPNGSASTNNETTQVNQLAATPMTANGSANPPAQPPATQPPATQPPATQPPAMPPPATPPPATQPPTMQPPATPGPTPTPGVRAASAGCGVSQGMPANPTTIADPDTILTFPQGYNGSAPFPIAFAFHGAGRTNTDMRMIDSRTVGSQLENNYVMAYVKSQGSGWDLGTDYPRFQRLLTQVLSERCIDTGHIFAIGHSSGAQYIAGMLGDSRARETRFAAVAPVSSNNLNNPAWTPLPTLLMHGLMDTQRPNDLNGAQDISQYAKSNQCTGGTQPVNIGSCNSIAGGVAVNPGCVSYNGCAEVTLFCNHNDPNYLDNGVTPTNHGWPCFANSEIFAFFEATR